MKVSGARVAKHRAALVAMARKLLRERGFDGAGVVEISRAAGLTQGALYSQFKSKDALIAEACRGAAAGGQAAWAKLEEGEPNALAAMLDAYLSPEHLDDVGAGCLLAACISEVRRQDHEVASAFAEGIRALLATIERAMPNGTPREVARRRALTLLSAMVGAASVARALDPTDPTLAQEVITASREELERLVRDGGGTG